MRPGEESRRVRPEGSLGKARAWRLAWLTAIAAVSLGACAGGMAPAAPAGGAAERFAAVRQDPPELRAFLYRMPKGADLHIHLTGAVYAETYVRSAAAQGLCVQTASLALAKPPCGPKSDSVPAADLLKDKTKFARLIDSLSMRDFVPSDGFSGHDQFFATFARFGAATDAVGDLSAEVVDRAGHEREQHIELMTTWQGSAARALGRQVGWSDDFAALQQRLVGAGLASAVADARRDIDAAEARRLEVLGCGRPEASPGCGMSVRYIQQVSRTNPPAEVFAQTLLAFMLAQADPRVVGLNFVAPEDDPVALADYDLQMRMLDYLHGQMPSVHIALHAGELTLGLVEPARLRDHVREAVEVGHAERIGHGVDVMYEERPWELLDEMAARRVAVEISLTSNDVILGVRGRDHPFPVYRRAGVPTVISTDDEGVARTDLTHELQRAVETYGLGYADLVVLARSSLEFSFLPGTSLWADTGTWRLASPCAGAVPGTPPPSCAALIRDSEKAARQWRLEEELRAFDREMSTQPGPQAGRTS